MSTRGEYCETKTGDMYEIRYERDSNGVYHIFPEYYPENPYDPSVYDCHLCPNGEVCIDKNKFEPRSLENAKACAFVWMSGYSQYVRTGEFPATGGRVSV